MLANFGAKARAAGEAALRQDKRIDLRIVLECEGHGFVRGAVGFVEHNQEVEVRDAFDRITAHRAAVETAGVKILAERSLQCRDRLV